jgi:AcrR family transcriptional regulator
VNRDGMLNAAEEVVLRDGIGRLTLDAVAKEADLSKGGLMHHFPTKDALIDAMVRRKVDAWRTEYEAAIARQPAGPGRVLRALVELCLADTDPAGDAECRRCFVMVAALVHDARHVVALREVHRDLAARVEKDGLPPGFGEAVHLAMSGLWFDRMFGLTEFTREKLIEIRTALRGVVEEASAKVGGAKRAPAVRRSKTSTQAARNGLSGSSRSARSARR